MTLSDKVNTLRAEMNRSLEVLKRMEEYLEDFQQRKLGKDEQPGRDEAIVVSQLLTNYYTCLETIFFRISDFFENNLAQDRWHQDLLKKMTLEIPGLRKRVISDYSHSRLLEFLKFRHFSRYYFELDYDWDKLRFLLKKYAELREEVRKDINSFDQFLVDLSEIEDLNRN